MKNNLQNQELISCIISSYNHEKYIGECIESIAAQNYQNLELIIIDDNSKDKTFEIALKTIEKFKDKFKKIVTLKNEINLGTAINMGQLINLAEGNFLLSIASDDKLMTTNSIDEFYKVITSDDNIGLVSSDSEFIDKNSLKIFLDENLKIYQEKTKNNFESFFSLIKSNKEKHGIFVNEESFGNYELLTRGNHVTSGGMFRKEIFKVIEPLNKEAPLEDWFLALQISKFYKIKLINKKLYAYRIHGENTVANLPKMLEITRKTAEFEAKLVALPKYANFKESALKYYISKEKNYLGGIIKIARKANLVESRREVYLFGILIFKKSKPSYSI